MLQNKYFVTLLFCAVGISQAEMLAFLFDAARESEKLVKHVSHDLCEKHKSSKMLALLFGAICKSEKFESYVSYGWGRWQIEVMIF